MSSDDPDIIADIISKYPAFRDMYQHIFDICQNTERVMGMFSKELRELDRNTVQLMIDEMQEDLIKQKSTIDEQKSTIMEQNSTIVEQRNMLDEQNKLIESLKKQLADSQKK